MTAPAGVGIDASHVTGFYQVQAALKSLDKNAARRMDAAINKAAREVAGTAQGLVVHDYLSGFMRQLPGGTVGNRRAMGSPSEGMNAVRKGIKVKRYKQKRFGNELRSFVAIVNTAPVGAIWELAGRKSSGHTPAGIAMIKNITKRDKGPSRTVWRAADQSDMASVEAKIDAAIEVARKQVQVLLNKK